MISLLPNKWCRKIYFRLNRNSWKKKREREREGATFPSDQFQYLRQLKTAVDERPVKNYADRSVADADLITLSFSRSLPSSIRFIYFTGEEKTGLVEASSQTFLIQCTRSWIIMHNTVTWPRI